MKKSDFLKQQYNAKVTEAENLLNEGKIEESNQTMDEADKIKEKLQAQLRIEEADDEGSDPTDNGKLTDPEDEDNTNKKKGQCKKI